MADKTRISLESVIKTAINSALLEVHTCLPAVVTRFDADNQLIDCQITIKRKMSGEQVLLPLLVNVPVRYPKSTSFSITFPLEVNDHVMLIFCERSIDTWLTHGDIQDPFDVRKFELSDAFAIPAMYPQPDVIPDFNASNLEIKTNSGDTAISIFNTEGIRIKTTANLFALCFDLIATVSGNLTAVCENSATILCNNASVQAGSNITLTAPLTTVNGDLTVTGDINSPNINASSSLIVDGQEQKFHLHPYSDNGIPLRTGPPESP